MLFHHAGTKHLQLIDSEVRNIPFTGLTYLCFLNPAWILDTVPGNILDNSD